MLINSFEFHLLPGIKVDKTIDQKERMLFTLSFIQQKYAFTLIYTVSFHCEMVNVHVFGPHLSTVSLYLLCLFYLLCSMCVSVFCAVRDYNNIFLYVSLFHVPTILWLNCLSSICQLYNNCMYSLLSVCLPYCTISVLHVPTLLWTVKSFLYVGHLISCISWVWQSTNLRSQQKNYSLLLYWVIFLIHKFTWPLTIPSSSNHEISCPWY